MFITVIGTIICERSPEIFSFLNYSAVQNIETLLAPAIIDQNVFIEQFVVTPNIDVPLHVASPLSARDVSAIG
ncbi:hypothetical protein HHI_06549 [Hyphomonas hirschiana VP5]|uniref:Uncharacterized protein n=1 Tax=Hyphomonas hirschiana VP5 TaxID=1280951 RepID=A0A059FX97_9PROT|nr:hypothetical protein HHI_06549 [Hyphomonas hirschiana VP5]